MGEAPSVQKEHILCILPFPEPTEILRNIQKKHPQVEFTYILQPITASRAWNTDAKDIPDGTESVALSQTIY
jgi:hypothetical protein